MDKPCYTNRPSPSCIHQVHLHRGIPFDCLLRIEFQTNTMSALAIITYHEISLAFKASFVLPLGSGGLPSDHAEMTLVEPHSCSRSSDRRNNIKGTLANRVAKVEESCFNNSFMELAIPQKAKHGFSTAFSRPSHVTYKVYFVHPAC